MNREPLPVCDREPSVALLPSVIAVTNKANLVQTTVAHAARLYEIIVQNPDVAEGVAWAATVAAEAEVLPRLRQYSDEQCSGRYTLFENDRIVGHFSIRGGTEPAEYSMGYLLDKSARGRGLAPLSVTALIEQACTVLDARHFYLQIKPQNEGSMAIAKRLGFYPAETVMGVDFPVEQQRWRLDL